jgi:RHH-type rel operon transcriptional repressor/antitoxin RelB
MYYKEHNIMISLRLGKELEQTLERVALRQGLSKSELVRRCLQRYLDDAASPPTPWDLGKDLFGKYASGRKDLSQRRKELVREKIHGRRRR